MDLGTRMKRYEIVSQGTLIRRMPVIIRVDGKAFHTLTRGLEPFHPGISQAMQNAAQALLREVQNAKLAYTQSDEISVLLMDDATFDTDQWFDGNVQKIVSISASIATVAFNQYNSLGAYFDARVFNVPREDVQNYFIWRQQDAVRNSLNAYAQMYFSHKDLHGKNTQAKHEMLKAKGYNWATALTKAQKNGMTFTKHATLDGLFTEYPELIAEIVKEKDV